MAGYSGSQSFAKALGAPEIGKVAEPAEDPQDVDDNVYDNAGKKPARISIRIKIARLSAHHKEWQATGGYHQTNAHMDMVPMWFWWAMPRFHPPRPTTRRSGCSRTTRSPSRTTSRTATVTGASGPTCRRRSLLAGPGVDPKPHAVAQFAPRAGCTGRCAAPRALRAAVSYVGVDNKGYGFGKGTSGREFLCGRPAGATSASTPASTCTATTTTSSSPARRARW